jgi:hypothetical protein
MNTARAYIAGAGTQTAALAFGGDLPPATGATTTQLYDGYKLGFIILLVCK